MDFRIVVLIIILALAGIGTIWFIVNRAKCIIPNKNSCPAGQAPFCPSADSDLICEDINKVCGKKPDDYNDYNCKSVTCQYNDTLKSFKWFCEKSDPLPPIIYNPFNVTKTSKTTGTRINDYYSIPVITKITKISDESIELTIFNNTVGDILSNFKIIKGGNYQVIVTFSNNNSSLKFKINNSNFTGTNPTEYISIPNGNNTILFNFNVVRDDVFGFSFVNSIKEFSIGISNVLIIAF